MIIKSIEVNAQYAVGTLHAEACVNVNCVAEQVKDIIQRNYRNWSGDTHYKSCMVFWTEDYKCDCYGSDYAYETVCERHEDGSCDITILFNRYNVE